MDSVNKTDQELVATALQDRHAFAAIVERYEKPLTRYVRRLGADTEAAKDILQESFIKTYTNLNDYDSALSFSAWLYRIVHNEAVSYFRKQQNRPHAIENEEIGLFEKIADELDIEHEANVAIIGGAVRTAVESLDAKFRDVIILRYFENKSYAEISDILEIPEGTVSALINRAKVRLKKSLERYDESK